MDFVMNLIESIFRWLHVVFGILWIGFLYFLNFVNAAFEGTLDAETKKKVIPELRPRVLFWFRMAAAMTWLTGVFLLLIVYYHGGAIFDAGGQWGFGAILMIALVFVGPFIYDALVKGPLKDLQTAFIAGIIISAVLLYLFEYVGGFGVRGYAIHLGATFGTIMAFNVWFRIWPSQRKIITAIKEGQAPDAALVALAGQRSRHNTYMSVPLVFMMLSQHSVIWAGNPISLTIMVLVGWGLVYYLYDAAGKVKGF
ncbi:MAG: urate hydroxylase PuuD [Deltaproteobacteria bacterium]|nr:urate hydroxylase PuuD [Deltaproteobacteria bacterium]